MAPKTAGPQHQSEAINKSQNNDKIMSNPEFKRVIVWKNVVIFAILHIAGSYGLYLAVFHAKWLTSIYAALMIIASGFGITAGAHRLWSHRTYKANFPLQILLMILNTIACQNSIIEWVRDHRVHHKYTETDADPHNAKRGFFFAHVGWLLSKKHPDVRKKGHGIDFSDVEEDPVLIFQRKYYVPLVLFFWLILPTAIPIVMWNETWTNALFVAAAFRYTFTLNSTWSVNSAAHLFGNKPYDKTINPTENRLVSLMALGEGWHNYHHVFPWDYKTAELGDYDLNFTTAFIDFFAKIGWAYDLKTVSKDIIEKRVKRTGDETHEIWGWGDKDQPQQERDSAIVINAKSQKDK